MSSAGTFADLISQLAAAHTFEVQSAKDECIESLAEEYNTRLQGMEAEIGSLRMRLGEGQQSNQWNGTSTHLNMESANIESSAGVGQERNVVTVDNVVLRNMKSMHRSTSSLQSAKRVVHTLKPIWFRHRIWGTDDVTLPASVPNPGAEWHYGGILLEVSGCLGCEGCVMFPHSPFRTVWDLISLVLVLGDIIMLPFLFAFDPEPSVGLQISEWFSLLFWTADMAQGPFLGYFKHGDYVKSRERVWMHYLRTWFLVDVLVVVPEWLVFFLGMDGDSPIGALSSMGKLFKTIRIVRVLRLLRIPKLKRVVERLYDLSTNEFSFAVLSVIHLIAFVLVLNHLVACAWYAVGDISGKHGRVSWISSVVNQQDQQDKTTLYALYLSSLHWSLTQFTPASMKVSACNDAESLFSIIVLFFAMIVFASFVGSITNHITRLRSFRGETTKQLWLLRRFLKDHYVDQNLGARIHKFVEAKITRESSRLQLTEIDILSKLSPALRDELAYELHSRFICAHPFFAAMTLDMEVVVHRICRIGLKSHHYAVRELVFSAGDEGKYMFVVQSGELDYNCAGVTACICADTSTGGERTIVFKWIAEAVLWTAWRHRGQLKVGPNHSSEVLVVDPEVFFHVMSKHPRSWLYAAVYAEHFVAYLNGQSHMADFIPEDTFYQEATSNARMIASNPWSSEADIAEQLEQPKAQSQGDAEVEGGEVAYCSI